jgi:hypothetical protein
MENSRVAHGDFIPIKVGGKLVGCPMRVYANKDRWKTHWTCSIIIEHNCASEAVSKTYRNMTPTFIADMLQSATVASNLIGVLHLVTLKFLRISIKGI